MAVRPIILVDTREKRPWTFAGLMVKVKAATLHSGDYSLDGHHIDGIVIERKSNADLFGSMTSGRGRFMAELTRMKGFERAYLVVEATIEDIMHGSTRTNVSPTRMLESLFLMCLQCNIHPVFCAGSLDAQDMAHALLRAYWKHKGEM